MIKRCAGETYYYSGGSTTLLNCNPLNSLARRGEGWFLVARLFSSNEAQILVFFLSLSLSLSPPRGSRVRPQLGEKCESSPLSSILSCCAHECTRVCIRGMDARVYIHASLLGSVLCSVSWPLCLQKVGEGNKRISRRPFANWKRDPGCSARG